MLRRAERLDPADLSDADWSVYMDLRRRVDPIRREHVVVNTAADSETLVARLLATLGSSDED
jgi:hypothetical protein